MRKIIVWLKNDLRLADNEMLFKAARSDQEVLPLYIFDPRHFNKLPKLSFSKTGSHRAKFLIESVASLRSQLKSISGNLIVRMGHPEEIIPELVRQIGASEVYFSKEVAADELELCETIEKSLNGIGVATESFWQSTLLHEEDVPWPIRQVPQVFTDFRKEAEKETEVRALFPVPERIKQVVSVQEGDIPDLNALGVEQEKTDERAVFPFEGGEKAALKRLEHYFWRDDLLKNYKTTRNGLLGADYSSKLSPWLATGCISAKYIYYEIKRYEKERKKNRSTYWLFFELLWRDFFKYMAKQNGAGIFLKSGLAKKRPNSTNNLEKFKDWQLGETGEPFVDANMRELLLTGYMSNRGRQNVASYLIYDLKVNWTWGAAWFENRLIDYDPCSNWLNWAYIAGVGNDPREGRHFNIKNQQQKYDQQGEYVKLWLGQ